MTNFRYGVRIFYKTNKVIGADKVFYQDIKDLEKAAKRGNKAQAQEYQELLEKLQIDGKIQL